MQINRREFLGGAAGFFALGGCASFTDQGSVYAGIPIGVITYSYRSMPAGAGNALKYVLGSGISTIELMSNDVEIDAGAPMNKLSWKMTKEDRAAIAAWRLTADLRRFEEARVKYAAAGVDVHIVKFGDIDGSMTDAELDYRFRVARAMGAGAITREVPNPKDIPAWIAKSGRRLAKFAEKWEVKIAFHNHLQIDDKTYDGPLLDASKQFMINFDIGHFTAANDTDPLAMVKKYHDRIYSIHVKDRTTKAHGQKNLAFGQGDTPLAGLFSLMKREGYSFPCDIELEYAIPQGSDAVREVGVSREYCRGKIG